MSKITQLSQETIDKIAAGEVVERPGSVVKELVENAIDAKASAITVEIKEGGISLIRITDNGCGIEKEEVPLAFLRHSTSKIKSAEDLMNVQSLGFRGEALSSIAAVSRVELITKTYGQLMGVRYRLEGSKEISFEEVGAPDGTTFLVKDLFYNTPARRKFLKTPQTEGAHIQDMMEKLALSHPDISFKFMNQNQIRLHTSGNGKTKDLIYHIYGREITAELLEVDIKNEFFHCRGYIGKPTITRGNRNFENYFINGRYVKSSVISSAIEEAYRGYLMQHQYPFTVLYFTFFEDSLDVNVHPTKMELRISNQNEVYQKLMEGLRVGLSTRELIPQVPVGEEEKEKRIPVLKKEAAPEPFEVRRLQNILVQPKRNQSIAPEENKKSDNPVNKDVTYASGGAIRENMTSGNAVMEEEITLESISRDFLTKDAKKQHKVIGQLFQTYWLIEYGDQFYIVDQHAAHEKVLYEKTMAKLQRMEFTSQQLCPPIIITLDAKEQDMLQSCLPQMKKMGYEIEAFGGKEFMISAVPDNLFSIDGKELLIEMLDELSELNTGRTPELIMEKVASMSCKAAVKGHDKLTFAEMDALMEELLECENPFHCPHGRPTIIAMSKYEIEKKFKRIV